MTTALLILLPDNRFLKNPVLFFSSNQLFCQHFQAQNNAKNQQVVF